MDSLTSNRARGKQNMGNIWLAGEHTNTHGPPPPNCETWPHNWFIRMPCVDSQELTLLPASLDIFKRKNTCSHTWHAFWACCILLNSARISCWKGPFFKLQSLCFLCMSAFREPSGLLPRNACTSWAWHKHSHGSQRVRNEGQGGDRTTLGNITQIKCGKNFLAWIFYCSVWVWSLCFSGTHNSPLFLSPSGSRDRKPPPWTRWWSCTRSLAEWETGEKKTDKTGNDGENIRR